MHRAILSELDPLIGLLAEALVESIEEEARGVRRAKEPDTAAMESTQTNMEPIRCNSRKKKPRPFVAARA